MRDPHTLDKTIYNSMWVVYTTRPCTTLNADSSQLSTRGLHVDNTMSQLIIENGGYVVTAVLGLVVLWLLTRRPRGMPPGPPLVPFLGNIMSMGADSRKSFKQLRSTYGDVFSVFVFNQPIIVLNGYEVLREALVKNADIFSDRPHSFFTDNLAKGRGITSTSGDVWKEQRKFAVSALREFGMGKSILEDKIQEEINVYLEEITRKCGKPFDIRHITLVAISNNICAITLGTRFEHRDPVFKRFLQCVEENVKLISSANIINIFPALRFLPGDMFKLKQLLRNGEIVEEEIMQPFVDEHLKTFSEDKMDDFIYKYIQEMKRRQKLGATTMNEKNLLSSFIDVIVAGTETTATTICWTLVYFLNYPDVQEKCFQEIKEKIGLNRSPSMKDKTSLPYLEATIAETLRLSNVVPHALPHSMTEDFDFRGFTFRKGQMILVNLESVLRDQDIWGDPEIFRPGRFLDEDGNFIKREELLPFSLGRRVCLGESMARMELFLFLAAMIQRFEFCSTGDKPSMEGDFGLTHSPKAFEIQAKLRI